MKTDTNKSPAYTSSRNACKLCAPLGASLVFKGIRGCIPVLHGSQGCATYIRRYLISHYKEPVDIASSNFSEESTIFGGNTNFITGMDNVIAQYNPEVIGIASTCLSETIGEDIPALVKEYRVKNSQKNLPEFIHVSTPSYNGSHSNGFSETMLASVSSLAKKGETESHINIFPGFVSPADIRYIREIISAFHLPFVLFPDYSDTLDNPNWSEYQIIPEGGTPVDMLIKTGSAKATIEFGMSAGMGRSKFLTAGEWLEKSCNVPLFKMKLPVGIDATDEFIKTLEHISGIKAPDNMVRERGRLVDAYVDGHKYVFGKKACVYGEKDFVTAMMAFLAEIGMETVLAGTGDEVSGNEFQIPNGAFLSNLDFETMNEMANDLQPDIFVGNSKGYYIARRLKKPLVRVGFPIHDRFGGQRLLHLGYRGTQMLFDRVVNALIEYKQENSPIGYKYI
ncbi:MAG: nitrogenase [Bacteroidales bacterium]|nr:nitrogenase [Bacteroidales bacterium]